MFISTFRLAIIILASAVAGMNVFNVLSARANGQSMQMPILACLTMLAIIAMMLVLQHIKNKNTK